MRYGEATLDDKKENPILKAFFSTVPGGKREYREHHHAECELSTIISGSGIYTVGQKEYAFSAGDVFLFGGDEVHCLTDISDNFLLLNIQFKPQLLWADSDAFSVLRIFFARNNRFENKIENNAYTREIHNKIILLSKELSDKRDGYALMVKYILYSILLTIVREYDYIDFSEEYTYLKSTIKSMRAALDYIDNNLFDASLSLKDIADRASMSPSYFSGTFKKMNSVSPWEYITIKRVEKAVELLKTTSLTKLDIAQRCGFSSSSNFYKAFSKVTGKNPSQICGIIPHPYSPALPPGRKAEGKFR